MSQPNAEYPPLCSPTTAPLTYKSVVRDAPSSVTRVVLYHANQGSAERRVSCEPAPWRWRGWLWGERATLWASSTGRVRAADAAICPKRFGSASAADESRQVFVSLEHIVSHL